MTLLQVITSQIDRILPVTELCHITASYLYVEICVEFWTTFSAQQSSKTALRKTIAVLCLPDSHCINFYQISQAAKAAYGLTVSMIFHRCRQISKEPIDVLTKK